MLFICVDLEIYMYIYLLGGLPPARICIIYIHMFIYIEAFLYFLFVCNFVN